MELQRKTGTLVIVGGAENKVENPVILREIVNRAGGDKARLVVLTVATDQPEESGEKYIEVFQKLGVKDVQTIDVSTREDAVDPEALELIENATGVFFTGGDQLHVTSLLGGTRLDHCLKERLAEGLLIAGTSAGAAMMANSMILGGEAEQSPRFGEIRIGGGMTFLAGTVIDTHFSQRGRFGRLLAAVAHYPQELGLGIDENTALVVEDGHFQVIGEGAVTVVDGGAMTYTNVPDLKEGDYMALYDVCVHVIPQGYSYDLKERRPITAPLDAERNHKQEHEDADQ